MTPDSPAAYEDLTPEEAAHIDSVCDRFEREWKATKAGGPAPHVATYLGDGTGPARDVLLMELVALDRACRERYGPAGRPAAGRPADPASIPGLELVDFLGSGGMGVVFKARQVTLDRDVAVKFLRDDCRADSGRRERFLQEARAVARLRHPHLVQLYEFGEVPAAGGATSQPYLVLEYVPGGSLAELLRGSPQPPREAARLLESLADGIHYAHEQGVIHRDLKPANVLLQIADCRLQIADKSAICNLQSAIAKVTDFGLAKFLAGGGLTHSGDLLGTPSYMAPEQAAAKGGPITAAVDVYGLGAILYEALTGRPPFTAATAEATLGLVCHDDPVPPRRLQPTVPRDLETICLKCLRKEPGRRYATARDLADDLRRFQAGEPVRARPVGTAERVVVWCRRKPAVAGLLAALVLVFFAGGAGVSWQWLRAADERDLARQEQARAQRHLHMVRDRVDRLDALGSELLLKPGQYRAGQAVLEEALGFYQDLLPEEGNDPAVRREAAHLYRKVAQLHHTLGHAGKAAEARDREAALLTSLLKEEPANAPLRLDLAISHRWRANALRDLGKSREAREAYDQAAGILEGLLRDDPGDAVCQSELSNTLLNTASLLSYRSQAGELEALYRRSLELDRAAVRAAPDNPVFNAELALSLGDQGIFFLNTGRSRQAEAAVRESLEVHQRVLAGGHLKGAIDRYVGRNYASLGRILATSGQASEAEQSYRKALSLLEPQVAEMPESGIRRAELARAQAGLASFLKDAGRRREAAEVQRRVIGHYELLAADCPENTDHLRSLVQTYLDQVNLLCGLGEAAEADETYGKVVEVDSEDPVVNNKLAWFLATAPEPRFRNPAEAVRLAEKAVAAEPTSGFSRNTLGVAHYRNGEDGAAVAALEEAMRLRADGDSCDWFFMAMSHWRLGKRDEARAWFDRAVQGMERAGPPDDEMRRFRAEAEALLGAGARRR